MLRQAVGLCLVGAVVLYYSAAILAQERIEPALENEPVAEPRQGQGAEDSETEPAQQPEESDRLLPAMNAIESAIRELVSADGAADRQRQEDREIGDLQAQQDMAIWAKRMTWATVAGVIVTAIGLYLIWQTLKATRVTAETAIKGNALNREAFINDQRAWLDVDVDIRSDLVWTTAHGAGHFAIAICVLNCGKSPAHTVVVGWEPDHIFGPPDADIAKDRSYEGKYYSTIFPGRRVIYKRSVMTT